MWRITWCILWREKREKRKSKGTERKFKWVYAKTKRRRAKKKCYASLIYRTSFKYFVSLSLHGNHPQPKMRFVFFVAVCAETHLIHTHRKREWERCFIFCSLAVVSPFFHSLSLFCPAMRCYDFVLSRPPTDSIYSLSFDIIHFTNSNLCNTRRQNIEREWMCHRKK